MDESSLVRELTAKLETVQHEKQRLERAIEGQADSIALKLRLALLAAGQGAQGTSRSHSNSTQNHSHRRRKLSSTSPSSSISASSTASTSSSTSFPSSPSPLLSPLLAAPSTSQLSPDVVTALRENTELRTRLANSERVNAYYKCEIADLRTRLGISIDELEELDPQLQPSSLSYPRSQSYTRNGGGASAGAGYTSSSRRRSFSTRGNGASATVGSIRIPGATSVSPPSMRLASTTSSFPSQPSFQSYSYSQSYPHPMSTSQRFLAHSYTSSINTTLTTPSTSFPIANPPAPTPSTSLDLVPESTLILPFSPLLAETSPTLDSPPRSFRSSSSLEPASADTPTKLTVITTALSPSVTSSRTRRSRGRRTAGSTDKGKQRATEFSPPTTTRSFEQPRLASRRHGAETDDRAVATKEEDEDDDTSEGSDPLVLAVTKSLQKLIAQTGNGTEEGAIARRSRRFSNEPQEDDEDTGDDFETAHEAGETVAITRDEQETNSEGDDSEGGSSTTSREEESNFEQLRIEITNLQRQIQLQQQGTAPGGRYPHAGGKEDEEGTPLSVSPGSGRWRREAV
ncbi:uncharacterized protein JCM15063_005360 [Sporobolomyces koalae]|uniref:uncharacterized protein n=1 Tax=Sporobolomyces koalae TaxID=500713 RepID=UPI00316C9C2A